MMISGAWMAHPGTQALCAALEAAGLTSLFVGGCVRNAILQEPVGDIDIATDGLPDAVAKVAREAGFKVVPTGIDHGTLTIIAEGRPHEVTTFRRDVETDGRHAKVAYSADVSEDARRRDFTMNALYSDRHGLVFDPIGGLPDLLARRVRFVGDPERRIAEDYLRILRFFRFHAQYGDLHAGLDPDGLRACAALSDGLRRLSKERVGSEFRKLLAALNPLPSLLAMAESGVLHLMLPGADVAPVAHLLLVERDSSPAWLRRLACLRVGPDADLRLSRAEQRYLSDIERAMRSSLAAAPMAWKFGRDVARDALMVRAATTFRCDLPQGWLAELDRGADAQFPVRAADLAPLAGAALGERLRGIEERWLASDLRLSRDELLR